MKRINFGRIKKNIRNMIVGVVLLSAIFVSAGIAYTWYTGRNITEDTVKDEPIVTSTPVVNHVQPADNVAESVSIQSLNSPITPGSNASVSIKTNPYSDCTIVVTYDKTESADSGLVPKTADDWGTLSWTWTVGNNVPIGKWPVKITCVWHERSAVVIGDLEVVSSLDK
jgi:hypothetical protein